MRMNISVPDELAEQVRALDLPISSICQKALGAAVKDTERQATFAGDLDAVAERLRGTVATEDRARYAEGHQDGVTWSKEYATVKDLEGLADGESDGLDPQSPSLAAFNSAKLGQHVISVTINVNEAEAYWDGFMRGAMEVWEAVYDRV